MDIQARNTSQERPPSTYAFVVRRSMLESFTERISPSQMPLRRLFAITPVVADINALAADTFLSGVTFPRRQLAVDRLRP
jgi:hypothetical protein